MVLEERCTVLHGVPTMFTAVIKELEKTGQSVNTIRKGFAAGTKVPRAMLLEMSEKLGFRHIASPYGESMQNVFFSLVSEHEVLTA
jgi:acyl-CoA synthetase (AMP-forming)/AMP-acid ligase II